jgi:CRISPR-associated protein Cmr2
MSMRLDISIGPVQGFVAQSRRTRDLWGSSYLLSFLSAHAMHGAHRAGGKIVRPVVDDDPLYGWVAGGRMGEPPRIGSIPNHFVLNVDGDASEVADAALRSLEAAWNGVCRVVWQRFVEHACPAGEGTEGIWRRQVGSFWEIMWTAGPSTAGGLLARRKHWRTHRLPDEPGDKCTVMHDLQELSGYVRAESSDRRGKQDAFWRRVRKRVGPLDLREDERLCAIALVKRLFPKVAGDALGWEVDTAHWPSTVYVGAVPWIRRAISVAPRQASDHAEAVERSAPGGVLHEWRSSFAGLADPIAGNFAKLDANYFHRGFVEDERLCPLREGAADDARAKQVRLLEGLCSAKDDAGRVLGPPPVFYALLLADGDRLGKLVGTLGGEPVGRALSLFTREAPGIVREHDGVTVYAGGDDVLAMLPVPPALSCARALAECYTRAFEGVGSSAATLSAAVVFAHVRLPLGAVIAEAHRLLDDVAKDANGRGSLAAGVLKRGGSHCQWVTTWSRRLTDGGSSDAVDLLRSLAERLGQDATDPGLSSALLYRVRETLGVLCGWPRWVPGSWGALPPGLDVRAFLHAEILRSLAGTSVAEPEAVASELSELVWKLLGPSRASAGRPNEPVAGTEAGVDALLLARFLASGGHEEDSG